MDNDTGSSRAGIIFRAALSLLIVSAVSGYVYGILAGKIQQSQKLGGVDLAIVVVALLAVAALLNPALLKRLTRLKLGNVEFELEKLQHAQQVQGNELDDLRFVLTLLLQPSELQHLKDLGNSNTQNRTGSHELRTELRKLRTMGLIQSRKETHIAGLKDGTKADLKDFVELTGRGLRYLERLGDERQDTSK